MLLFEQSKERQRHYQGSDDKIADFEKKIMCCPFNKVLETLSIITTMSGPNWRQLIKFLIVLLYILLQHTRH